MTRGRVASGSMESGIRRSTLHLSNAQIQAAVEHTPANGTVIGAVYRQLQVRMAMQHVPHGFAEERTGMRANTDRETAGLEPSEQHEVPSQLGFRSHERSAPREEQLAERRGLNALVLAVEEFDVELRAARRRNAA